MRSKKIQSSIVIWAACVVVASVGMWARPSVADISELAAKELRFPPEAIRNAVGLFLSPRGQSYLRDHLDDVLYRNGISVSEAYFDEYHYEAAPAASATELPRHDLQIAGQSPAGLPMLKGLLQKWLLGFDYRDPRFSVTVKDIEYHARFSRLGIRFDQSPLKEAGIRDGVGVVLEAEIPELQLAAGQVRAADLNNSWLGEVGANHLHTEIAPASVPLRLQLPFSLNVSRKDGVRLQALKVSTNLDEIGLQMGFDRPLLLPEVELRVNKKVMQLNPAAVEDEILSRQGAILKAVQEYLQDLAANELPGLINSKIGGMLAGGTSEINQMDPPGAATELAPADKFRWGIRPEQVELTDKHLFLGLSGFVEDPRNSRTIELPMSHSKTLRALQGVDPKSYDLALALNESFINRVLQLSFVRGYFEKIEIGPGEYVKLAEMPEIRISGMGRGDTALLKLTIEQEVSGFARIAVRNPVRVSFDAIIRFRNNGRGGIKLVLERIDEKSAQVDPDCIRMSIFEGKVKSAVQDKLKAANDGFAKKEKVLTEALPVPPAILGLPVKMKSFRTEDTGHIVLFLDYGF